MMSSFWSVNEFQPKLQLQNISKYQSGFPEKRERKNIFTVSGIHGKTANRLIRTERRRWDLNKDCVLSFMSNWLVQVLN